MCSFSDLAHRCSSHLHLLLPPPPPRAGEGEGRREGGEERQIVEFLTALALCHTVQVAEASPEDNLGCDNESFVFDEEDEAMVAAMRGRRLAYTASSPDEKALVEAAHRLGVTFAGADEEVVRVVDSRAPGPPTLKAFQRLHTLEFDSGRRRMSVVVRNPSGSLVLVTKGAESSVLPLCREGPVEEVTRGIDTYAVQGLRCATTFTTTSTTTSTFTSTTTSTTTFTITSSTTSSSTITSTTTTSNTTTSTSSTNSTTPGPREAG